MRFRLQLMTISDDGSERIHPVAELARGCELRPETTGLTLAEGKQILKQVQQVVIDEQVQTSMTQPTVRDLRRIAVAQRPSSDQTADGIRQTADQKSTSAALPL